MRKIVIFFCILIVLFGCKSFYKGSNTGSFRLVNNSSNKIIEFVWITPEGEFYPTAKSIDIGKNQIYEAQGLEPGYYDIAIDFKGEYNSFNSKKDKNLCLYIEKGLSTVWVVDPEGKIVR